ncbi:MAG: hypothetical protein EHM58_18745 [Ignavibacteriae bacterium]|nr:MAG: hypothetical protein EHM58_18745 [Ignavibacteriota bacterium]
MKKCKYLSIEIHQIDTLNGVIEYPIHICNLKADNQTLNLQMTMTFYKMGIPNAIPNNECPFAIIGNEEKCPWYKPV